MYRQSEKNLLSTNTAYTMSCPDNTVKFGPLTAEILSGVWGTPTNFNGFSVLLWSPYGIGQTIIFLPCMVSSSIFIFFLAESQSSQIGCLPYFHTWCGLSANFRCLSETCCTRLAENARRKKSPKIAIWAPSHNFVGLYLRN